MTTAPRVWLPSDDPAVRVLPWRLRAFALSPDDAWLACATEAEPAARRCVEVATGREAFAATGGDPVTGLAWIDSEQILLIRSSPAAARAELVAVPDGGLLGSVALPSIAARAHRVTASADGAVACVARTADDPVDDASAAAVVLAIRAPAVLHAVAAAAFDEGAVPVRRAGVTAALHPDGHAIAFAVGPARYHARGLRPGALWTLDLAAAAPDRVVDLGRLAPREVAWWSPARVVVRSANLAPSAPWHQARGDLHVVDLDARRVAYDALPLPPELDPDVRSRWIEPWVHASPSPDGARLVLCAEGINRATPAGNVQMGRVRVVDLATGRSDEPVELDTRVAVAASAAFAGDGLVTLTTRAHRAATLTWPGNARRVELRFGDGGGLSGMRVERSPAGRALVVWGYERRERDALALHVALVG
jgi:hypothetical protein